MKSVFILCLCFALGQTVQAQSFVAVLNMPKTLAFEACEKMGLKENESLRFYDSENELTSYTFTTLEGDANVVLYFKNNRCVMIGWIIARELRPEIVNSLNSNFLKSAENSTWHNLKNTVKIVVDGGNASDTLGTVVFLLNKLN
ncbi:hypothetical protein [Mucilaginibacter koreensis]